MVPLGRLACEEWPNGIIGKWTVCDSHNVKTNHHRQTTACSTHNMAGVIARPFRAVLAFHWKTIRCYARAPQCTHQKIQCVCLQIHSKTICLKTGELSVRLVANSKKWRRKRLVACKFRHSQTSSRPSRSPAEQFEKMKKFEKTATGKQPALGVSPEEVLKQRKFLRLDA